MTRDRFLAILESCLNESVVGEFWIIDGQAVDADGDVGIANHEMVVVQHVFSELIDALQETKFGNLAHGLAYFNDSDGIDTVAARGYILDATDDMVMSGIINHDEADDIETTIAAAIGWPEVKMKTALGHSDDARVYGYENLGWIRVVNNNIQIYGLTRSKLNNMANGLYDCFGDDWVYATYYLEDMQTGKTYNVPGKVIDAQDVSYLRNNHLV